MDFLAGARRFRSERNVQRNYERVGPRPSDVHLGSYPRSGSNHVRFLLTCYLSIVRQGEAITSYEQARTIAPNFAPATAKAIQGLPDPRIIKTHLGATKRFPRTIYVYRDGRKVYPSYYKWLVTFRGMEPIPFAEFLQQKLATESWGRHVSGWLDVAKGSKVMLCDHQELLRDPASGLRALVEFVGLPVDAEAVAQAARLGDQRTLQADERHIGDGGLAAPGRWDDIPFWTPSERALFDAQEQPVRALLGYSAAWPDR